MDINDPNMIDEELPSVKNFMQNESNLPSINDFISTNGEDDLPSCNEFVEVKEEVIVEEETHEPVDSQNDSTEVIVSLIESLRNSIPEVKSYDKELYELMNCIEEVRKDIPDVPEVKYYDEQISELQESIQEVRKDIPQVPEVKYYDSEISELKESIQEVRERDIPDFKWISKSFNNVSDDYEKLNSLLAKFKGNFDLEISNIVESIGVSKFESDIGLKRVNEELVSKVEETREIIHTRLKETSKNILSMKKEYKSSDKQLREEIKKEYLNLKEDISKSLQTLNDFDDSLSNKIDQVNSYFETLKHEVENLPEVKYYDKEIKNVNDSVKTVERLIKILEEKLNKKISNIEESILVSNEPEEIKEDPLTPLDQNFATLNDLSNHYRLFINRIQQQLGSLGGGGIEDAPKTGGPYVRQNQAWADLGSHDILKGVTGYEFTGAFVERTAGQSGVNDIGSDYEYPSSLASSQTWKRFGFSVAQQAANDNEYWGETNPNFDQTKGVFGGLYMPNGFSNMIDYSDTSVGAAVTTGNLKYTAANGSYDFTDGHPGMFAQIRFSYNITPLVAGTTVETALIWHTRNEYDDVTFSFTLTNQPITYDSNTVGRTLLSRVEITAYFASDEDVNARALPAIRADNRCIIQPLTTLVTLSM